ncbi:unnamed protein product [Sympodiomycopsis kandeliae]
MYKGGSRGAAFKPPSFLEAKAGSSSRSSPLASATTGGAFSRSSVGRPLANNQSQVNSKPSRETIKLVDSSDAELSDDVHGRASSSSGERKPPPSDAIRGVPGEEYYMCTWRKPQARKHKTWDGDAVLIVNRPKATCRLRCQENGRDIATGSWSQIGDVESGAEMMVGGKEIEIDRKITLREYNDGIPDKVVQPPSKKSKISTASNSLSTTSSQSPGSAKVSAGLRAAAPSASFYSKPMPKPMVKAQGNRFSPEVQKALDGERSESSHAPSPSSSTLQPRHGGLTKPVEAVQPRYDPNDPDAIVMKRPNAEHHRLYNRRHWPLVDVVVSPNLAIHLRPHQIEGVKFLYDRVTGIQDVNGNKGAILADAMGLGKTLQSITLIDLLLRQSPYVNPSASRTSYIDKALVVCPLSLVKNWKREFRKWLGPSQLGVVAVDGNSKAKDIAQRFVTSKREQVLIIGYEKLRSCIDVLSTAQPQVGLIICDEGHRLKSKDSKTTRLFNQLSTPRRIILTGTPIQNNLSELFAMMDFVCPGLLGPYNVFKNMFEDPIRKGREQYCPKEVKELGQTRSVTLSTVTSLVLLHRTADILDGFLLPKSESVVFCTPTTLQRELYRHILKSSQVRALTTGTAGGSALPLITMLRQLCDSPELLLKDATSSSETLSSSLLADARHLFPSKADRVSGDEGMSGKVLALSRMLAEIRRQTDDKVVLVSTFTSTLDVLEAFCKRKRYSYVRLDGQTKQDDRMELVNTFNRASSSASFVFLLSTKAGGVGLNLIGANRLFLMEPEWNPALDRQAMARIHRDGQTKHCYIYRMMIPGSMDEKIFQRQISKLGLSDTLMSKRSSPSDDAHGKGKGSRGKGGGNSSSGDSFSQEELKDIFTLHEDTPCLCHDQLICSCDGRGAMMKDDKTTDGKRLNDGESSDESDDDLVPPSFMPASMQQASRDKELAAEAKSRLAGLSEWRHFDTRNAFECASLDDTILDGVVQTQKLTQSTSTKSVSDRADPLFLASSSQSSALDDTDSDDVTRSNIKANISKAAGVGDSDDVADQMRFLDVQQHEAGNIVYVFSKSTNAKKEISQDDSSTTSEGESIDQE